MTPAQSHMVKEALAELADAEYRERVWLAADGEVSSPEESFCQLFDDSGLGHALDSGGGAFNASIDDKLRALDQLPTKAAAGTPAPRDVLDHDEIDVVRGLAAAALFEIIRLEAGSSA